MSGQQCFPKKNCSLVVSELRIWLRETPTCFSSSLVFHTPHQTAQILLSKVWCFFSGVFFFFVCTPWNQVKEQSNRSRFPSLKWKNSIKLTLKYFFKKMFHQTYILSNFKNLFLFFSFCALPGKICFAPMSQSMWVNEYKIWPMGISHSLLNTPPPPSKETKFKTITIVIYTLYTSVQDGNPLKPYLNQQNVSY